MGNGNNNNSNNNNNNNNNSNDDDDNNSKSMGTQIGRSGLNRCGPYFVFYGRCRSSCVCVSV